MLLRFYVTRFARYFRRSQKFPIAIMLKVVYLDSTSFSLNIFRLVRHFRGFSSQKFNLFYSWKKFQKILSHFLRPKMIRPLLAVHCRFVCCGDTVFLSLLSFAEKGWLSGKRKMFPSTRVDLLISRFFFQSPPSYSTF